jgi:hypothetical protein
MRRAPYLAVLVASVLSCHEAPPAPREGPLAPGIAARVGQTDVPVSLVEGVARAQHVPPRTALDLLVGDAVAAEHAKKTGLSERSDVRRADRALRARLVLDRIRQQAQAGGPPTEAEIRELTELHWKEIDAPPARVVLHAVVLRPKKGPAEQGPDVARALAAAVAGVTDPALFESRAKGVDGRGLEIRVEKFAFVADGRFADPGMEGTLDPGFVAAAFAVPGPPGQSPVTETPFGWHVILVLEDRPARSVPMERRAVLFREEVMARRGVAAQSSLLEDARRHTRVDVEPSAAELTAQAASLFAR